MKKFSLSVKILLLLLLIIVLQIATARILMAIFGYGNGRFVEPRVAEVWAFLFVFSSLLIFVGGINRIIIRRITKLSDATRRVAKGEYGIVINEENLDEIGILITNFNLMAKELKSNEYLNRDFVKNFSHELKTPVSSIKGYAELIENASKDTEISEYASIIRLEAERLSNLSESLLMISRLDANVIIKQDDEFLLDEQIRQVILVMQGLWEAKGIEFDLNLEQIQISSNKELLYVVWQNLISNAIKFSPEGGKITISLKLTDTVQFEISDNGIGFSLDDGEKIFKEFFLADKSRNKSGSGLGLTIAKKIIEKLNGLISCKSDVGQGATFFVSLPALSAKKLDDIECIDEN